MKKQLVSILFALCMVLCLVPLAVFAEGETENVQAVTDQTTLVAAMADGTVTTVKLVSDIDIDATLTVDRAVTLDLNGKVLQMTGNGSVITIKDGGNLTLTDSNTTAEHKFTPNGDGLWVSDENGSKTVSGGVITGGTGTDISTYGGTTWYCGGGVYIEPGGQLTMTGGNIIGCSAESGGGVCIDSELNGKQGQFSMTGGSIAGCVASDIGGGVCVSGTFKMSGQAVIRSCTVESATQYVCGGGVYVNVSSRFEMSDTAIIEGCQAISTSSNSSNGGGVYVSSSSSFVMSEKAQIEACQAISNSSRSKGGGVHLSNNTTLTLSGSAVIQNCTATNSANPGEAYGGGVSAACVKEITLADSAHIVGCAAANGSGLYITGSLASPNVYGKLYANGGSVDGDVVLGDKDKNDGPGTITGTGVTVFKGKVTVTPGSTIESGTFNGEVINNGTITGGTFSGGITGTPALATGSGTKNDPYQIGTAEGLKLFHDIVNGENGRVQNTAACATLTADIVLNDGTFDEDGNYTPGPSGAATPTEWTFIGRDYDEAYSGTFDGAGHTIQGIYCNDQIKGRAGLFGYVNGATIKDIKVTGYIKTYGLAGGIAAYIRGGTSITDCVNAATVIAGDTRGYSPSAGGIVGCSEREQQNQITDCINTGTVKVIVPEGDYSSAGGILGQAINCTLISNCSNFGPISGGRLENATSKKSYVGGIAGRIVFTTVSDCYNVGVVTDTANPEPTLGGIVGILDGTTSLVNSYNVGSVTATSTTATLGGVAGSVSRYNNTITNCYYLTDTAGQACGKNDGVITNTTEKSAFDFANGGVLALLMAGRSADAQPWDTTCKYLESAGMTLPVFARQNLTVHAHVWSTYTTDTAAKTHTRSCACGVAETEACTITPATCKDGSACAVCGQQYGGPDTGKHADLQHFPAVAATTDAEGNKEYWYCGGCGKYFADAAATKEITRADTVTAKLPQPTTPPTATPTAQPTTAPQAAEQPRRTAQPTVQPTAAPTVQPVSTIPATGDTSSPILWAALLLCSGAGVAVTAYKKNRHRS